MGTFATDDEPRKKRPRIQGRRQLSLESGAARAAPNWERTRAFGSELKSNTTSLPTISNDGTVHRRSVQAKKFQARKTSKKNDRKGQDEVQPVAPQTNEKDPKIQAPRCEGGKRKAASFHGTEAYKRQELEKYAKHIEDFETTKANIARIATKIVANPEENAALLRQLRQIAQSQKGRSAGLVILTLAQLFKDIAPAYRIRSITHKEAEVKVSKEVARIRNFEQVLLDNYKSFVKSCISITRWRSGNSKETDATKKMRIVRQAACKALLEMISSLSHFNEAEVVAVAVCKLTMDRELEIRKLSSGALKEVLASAHRVSGPSLDTCVVIAKTLANLAGERQLLVSEEAVMPLMSIQFRSFATLPKSLKKKNEPKKSKRYIHKRRRKQTTEKEPDDAELERDLREAEAEAAPNKQYAARKHLLDAACHAYFNVIQKATRHLNDRDSSTKTSISRHRKPHPALFAALKGLLQIVGFIDANVLEATLQAVAPLLEQSALPLAIRFRCLSATYAVITSHNSSQKSESTSFAWDPRTIDSCLYSALGCLFGRETSGKDEEYVAFDATETVVAATSNREVPLSRCAALSRRLSILAASATPTHACAIGLLLAAQQLMPSSLVSLIYTQKNEDGQEGLDGEQGTIQEFDINANDPETGNAEHSAAWELASLACHYHPVVREIAKDCSKGQCGSKLPRMSKSIVLRAKEFKSSDGGFNPAPASEPRGRIPRKALRDTHLMCDNVLSTAITDPSAREQFLSTN